MRAEEGNSYGVPAFKFGGKEVGSYSHAARHCSYLPHSGSVLAQAQPASSAGYGWSKGSLRFTVDAPPDEALVRRFVELRLAEISS